MGDALWKGSSQGLRMTNRNLLKSYCFHRGEQFGHSWGDVDLKPYRREVHSIPGETKFDEKAIKFHMEYFNK